MIKKLAIVCALTVLLQINFIACGAPSKPYENGKFKGRIAYSADGNHNDRDDWMASPVALAIFAEAGVKDQLVHFDYNCILPVTDLEWEKIHAESVLGGAEKYGFKKSIFFDCRKTLDAAVDDLAKAINESSSENPLYFIIAGPMEVPYMGIQKSDPAKRKFVYCISHSRWNDGFSSKYKFTFTKRSVIEQDVNWLQIRDQNRLLSLSKYGQPAKPEEFAGFFWMRDSKDAKVKFLWDRTLISTRPDPSDAGMAYFAVTGDEDCDPIKLKHLIEDHQALYPNHTRKLVRIEAENFRHFENFKLEESNDKSVSQRLLAASTGGSGSIRTRFDEPFAPAQAKGDISVRFQDPPAAHAKYTLKLNDKILLSWKIQTAEGESRRWSTQNVKGVDLRIGDEITILTDEAHAKIDFVELSFP